MGPLPVHCNYMIDHLYFHLHSRLDLNKSKVELLKSTHLKSSKNCCDQHNFGFGWIWMDFCDAPVVKQILIHLIPDSHPYFLSVDPSATLLFRSLEHMAPRSRPQKKPVDKASRDSRDSCPLASRKWPCLTNCDICDGFCKLSSSHETSPMPAWWK